eukprot:scaffold403880_cov18-Prasinocladus_malaysianus.AAC.2
MYGGWYEWKGHLVRYRPLRSEDWCDRQIDSQVEGRKLNVGEMDRLMSEYPAPSIIQQYIRC